jgi:hypothetical protein
MKRFTGLFDLVIGAVLCTIHLGSTLAIADVTSVAVTVGPNADKGVGYGTFEGAKILTLTITPQIGYTIASSQCTDTAGTDIWFPASASASVHVWKTYGVLPNFSAAESHAAIIHGTLATSGTGTGVIPFDVKVNDIDIDADALMRHADAVWTPTDPSSQPALNDLEDKCEAGDGGGFAMPITDPGTSLPATCPANTGKALRVCINAKKAGSLVFGGVGSSLAIYRQSGSQQSKVTQSIGITTGGLSEMFYLHTCAGFAATNVTAEFTPVDAASSAKDTVRIYALSEGYQLFVNTPAATDDYVPVVPLGRVPVTVTRNPVDITVDLKLKDSNVVNPILFYDAAVSGTGVIEKSFTMAAGTSSKTFWVSGNTDGKGARTIILQMRDGQDWVEKRSLNVFVFDMLLKELGFAGVERHTMRKTGAGFYSRTNETFKTNGDRNIDAPEWKDGNGDRRVDDGNVDRNDPVCYTAGANPTINAKFEFSPSLPVGVEFRVVGESASDLQIRTTEEIFDSIGGQIEKTFHLADLGITKNHVGSFPLWFSWKGAIDGGPQFTIVTSKTQWFVTYGTPVTPQAIDITARRIDWAVFAVGQRNLAQIADPGMRLTMEDIPWNLKLAIGTDGHFQGGEPHDNPWEIMDAGKVGNCYDFARLLKQSLDIIGVPPDKSAVDEIKSHGVQVTKWLGLNAALTVHRSFLLESGSEWINEWACGVDVADSPARIWYDVASRNSQSRYGPKKNDANEGRTIPAGYIKLVDNMWREPNGGHGPVMFDWPTSSHYAPQGIDGFCPQVRVAYPNGGQSITIGQQVAIRIFTAGLQGRTLKVYWRREGGGGIEVPIGNVVIGTEPKEVDNFNKENTITWNTTNLATGSDYRIYAEVDGTVPGDETRFSQSTNVFMLTR